MILNDEQQQAVNDLAAVAALHKTLKVELQEEFDRMYQERSQEVQTRRSALARYCRDLGVPKRRIGLALGTQDFRTVQALLGDERSIKADETQGTVTITLSPGGDVATFAMSTYIVNSQALTGEATLNLLGDEWMAATEDELDLAVERAIFGDTPDEALKEKFLAATVSG